MNSYFASVEQQANPFLRGKPVGVCAYLTDNGCIIASSIEAKAVGIKTGCRVRDARQLHPGVTLVQNDPPKYRSTTEKIFSILNDYTDEIEPYSIDEAFLDLSGHVSDFAEARKMAETIGHRIRTEVGEWLGASIGLSFTKFLAKLASDCTGPDSILILEKKDLPSFYSGIGLTDIWGINTRLEARLHALGIASPLDLIVYPIENLMRALGKPGYYLWASLNGQDIHRVTRPAEPKSVGHSYCVPKRTTDPVYHRKILMKLCEKTGRRLRRYEKEARGITLYWREYPVGGGNCRKQLSHGIMTSLDIFRASLRLYEQYKQRAPISMLAVTVFALHQPSRQLSLFYDPRQRARKLGGALDHLNDRYGEYTVFWGSMWATEKNALDRIGFRKTIAPSFNERGEIEFLQE